MLLSNSVRMRVCEMLEDLAIMEAHNENKTKEETDQRMNLSVCVHEQ